MMKRKTCPSCQGALSILRVNVSQVLTICTEKECVFPFDQKCFDQYLVPLKSCPEYTRQKVDRKSKAAVNSDSQPIRTRTSLPSRVEPRSTTPFVPIEEIHQLMCAMDVTLGMCMIEHDLPGLPLPKLQPDVVSDAEENLLDTPISHEPNETQQTDVEDGEVVEEDEEDELEIDTTSEASDDNFAVMLENDLIECSTSVVGKSNEGMLRVEPVATATCKPDLVKLPHTQTPAENQDSTCNELTTGRCDYAQSPSTPRIYPMRSCRADSESSPQNIERPPLCI